MADGINIRLEGGARLDRILSKMAITHQSAASRIVNSVIKKAAAGVRKSMKPNIPKTNLGDTTGFKTVSRNVSVGQLRNSLKSGLRNKVNIPRDVFLGGVWFNEGGGKGKKNDDGFFAKFVYDKPHKDNAFGFSGGRTLKKIVAPTVNNARKIIGTELAKKIAIHDQKMINKL